MATLLEKTRKINKLLQKAEVVEYDSISRVLSNVIEANVYIVSKTGKIFGNSPWLTILSIIVSHSKSSRKAYP